MTESNDQSRRVLLASALGTGAALALMPKAHAEPVRSGERQMFASWVHGAAVQVEKRPDIVGGEWNNTGGRGDDAIIASDVAGGVLRFGWGGEMYVRGRGGDWLTQTSSGRFWVHYAIPTPVIEGGRRSVARTLIVRWNSPDNSKITFDAVHVYDGGSKFRDISGEWGATDEPERRIGLGDQIVDYGFGVSLRVRGNATTFATRLTVHAVGVDFFA